MFGHCRNRSLIPVKDLEKYTPVERCDRIEEEEDVGTGDQPIIRTSREKRNLVMIYLLFLAEAIMASSLSSQIAVVVPSSGCLNMDTSFIRSILECSYFFGSAMGLVWGYTADKLGRRKVALFGLAGMATCCLGVGFVKTFPAFAMFRFAAGAIGSAVTVSGLAMLADATHGSKDRTTIVARLPFIAVCGRIGPLVSDAIRPLLEGYEFGMFAQYPGLSGQIACASFVFLITGLEVLLLQETLPQKMAGQVQHEAYEDSEKAAFLGQSLSNYSDDSLNVSVIESDSWKSVAPSHISISQMVTAPSIMMLLASFSVLSLHSSTFEVLLPHLGHIDSRDGGMGIPCAWLGLVITVVKASAALRVMRAVPFVVSKVGLLTMYRKVSLVFPILYALIPLVGLAVGATGAMPGLSTIVSIMAMLVKTTLASAAQVLVLLLVLSAAPDASSTGTVIGVVSVSQFFKALAVGISGMSYYVSDDYSIVVLNLSLWAGLIVTAIIGAFVTWKVRETPRVGADIPEECLVWQGMFDVDSEDEKGF